MNLMVAPTRNDEQYTPGTNTLDQIFRFNFSIKIKDSTVQQIIG